MNGRPGAYRKRKKTPKMIKKQREGEGEGDMMVLFRRHAINL